MEKLINIDPEVVSGAPVFNGTRVPIQNMFDYLEGGYTLDEFLKNFPGVKKEQAIGVLDLAGKAVISTNFKAEYENPA